MSAFRGKADMSQSCSDVRAAPWPDPKNLEHSLCHHEAGHAIVAICQGDPIDGVEVFADGTGGEFRHVSEAQDIDAAESKNLR
jgi:hypothetical protein